MAQQGRRIKDAHHDLPTKLPGCRLKKHGAGPIKSVPTRSRPPPSVPVLGQACPLSLRLRPLRIMIDQAGQAPHRRVTLLPAKCHLLPIERIVVVVPRRHHRVMVRVIGLDTTSPPNVLRPARPATWVNN